MCEHEIGEMLRGDHSNIKDEEGVAIMYAQHYADATGRPDIEAIQRLHCAYGDDKARDILSFIKIIMMTNAHANALHGLRQRLSGHAIDQISLFQELVVAFGFPFLALLAALHEFARKLIGLKSGGRDAKAINDVSCN